jgi:hypothetical protein
MTILADGARSKDGGSTGGVPRGQMPPGRSKVTGGETTLLKVEGNFSVIGLLETFANAGGVHLARAILAEFAENVAKLVTEQAREGTALDPEPLTADEEMAGPRQNGQPITAAATELSGGKILWRVCFVVAAGLSWKERSRMSDDRVSDV